MNALMAVVFERTLKLVTIMYLVDENVFRATPVFNRVKDDPCAAAESVRWPPVPLTR